MLEDLFDAARYNKRVRPVRNSQEAVNVTFGLVVREIVDLVRNDGRETPNVLCACLNFDELKRLINTSKFSPHTLGTIRQFAYNSLLFTG